MMDRLKLWFKKPKTVLVKPDLDFNLTSCDFTGPMTLVQVDVSEATYGRYPIKLKENERPGSVQILARDTGKLFSSIAPPNTVGLRGLEMDALVFELYVRTTPGNILVLATGAVKKYGVVKVNLIDMRE